jgi:hypothetical protein
MLANAATAARSDAWIAWINGVAWVVQRILGGVDGIVGSGRQPGLERLPPD